MQTVSLQELKRRLSEIVAQAAAGDTIVVTKHNRPIAQIGAVGDPHVQVGRLFGKGNLKPLLRNATRGCYLEVLQDDRRGERDGR